MDTIEKEGLLSSADVESAATDIESGERSSSKGLMEKHPELSVKHDDIPTSTVSARTWTASPPIVRLVEFGHRMQRKAQFRFQEAYPHIIDRLKRFLKLCGLTFVIIFVVALASFIMALSHWFTIVIGHLVLRQTVPLSIDNAFYDMKLDNTMIFAALGAFIVNLPPFITFVLSIPFTFDRTVLEGSTAPANEFIKRITPKNRYALLLLKYAPRLSAAPIGCKVFWLLSAPYTPEEFALDPLHAFMAGVAGEVVLTTMGLIKNVVRKRFQKDAISDTATSSTLPL
ncbi:hypothetical protein OH76DRAFT_1383686 [Lentinus brumalis]|uniref:Uncharacterized protein n=1 Tax=Lentinus brumalis TaxID=2498619 RepID=A0A371D6Z4_9APHY|nr:hypothetical protein OH76DRAFT_1383686 [Polyporus brumalis]